MARAPSASASATYAMPEPTNEENLMAAYASGDSAAFDAHARECAQCASVIREGDAMLELLDAHVHQAPIDPRLKARIMATVTRAPQRDCLARWEQHALACAGLWMSTRRDAKPV
jgi:hypothetical protein